MVAALLQFITGRWECGSIIACILDPLNIGRIFGITNLCNRSARVPFSLLNERSLLYSSGKWVNGSCAYVSGATCCWRNHYGLCGLTEVQSQPIVAQLALSGQRISKCDEVADRGFRFSKCMEEERVFWEEGDAAPRL
jgi:hypothetical protein